MPQSCTKPSIDHAKFLLTDSGTDDDQREQDLAKWRAEMQQRLQQESEFLSQIRARRPGANKSGDNSGNSSMNKWVAKVMEIKVMGSVVTFQKIWELLEYISMV